MPMVNRNTIVMVKLNSLFRETLVRLKKLYRSGNEKEKFDEVTDFSSFN